MKLLRCIALIVCLVPFVALPGVSQAAQPAVQAQQGKAAAKPAKSKPKPKAKLDLSLPADMVDDLEPSVGNSANRRKPLLPAMFTEKPQSDDSPFQLNGRLISNEMQLQMRNDSRRDVEGAAIDFEFRQ